jgi:cytochrome c oxidase subunit III
MMEAQTTRSTSTQKSVTAQIALLLVIGGETIFFGTLLSSYLFMRASAAPRPVISGAGLTLPILNTLVLLVSALIASWSERAIRTDQKRVLKIGLQVTLALGLVFIIGQVAEFIHSGMHPGDANLAGMYFALITFHALHVLAGVVLLALNLLRAYLGDFSARRFTAVQIGSWFWYYVTAVWVILFIVLYLV